MDQEYFQLIYVSAASADFDEQDLPDLLDVARRNNGELNITGMLLYHKRSFIQVLTGDQTAVESVFRKIEGDSRHHDTRVLYRGPVSERSFEDWSMGFYQSGKNMGEEVPGLNDVLNTGFVVEDEESKTRAIQILEGFRDGKWRQAVNH